MNFKRLKILRIKNNYTQEYIADILNTQQANYSKWENGIETIPFKKLFLVAKFYNISLDYLTGLSAVLNSNQVEKLDKKTIGKNIKQICKENNLTQAKLAKLLKTTQSTVSAFQNGKVLILTKYIFLIAKKFNVSIEKLCD
ncbi:MAG: helix-turn-helix transcriptional regulator [Bacilli bacterium]|nr:helix-turn-helix transcriptional regulator [Bacilli bacterium]